MTETGHRVAEKAKEVGNKVSEGAEKAADWAKEKLHQAGNRPAAALSVRVRHGRVRCTGKCDRLKSTTAPCPAKLNSALR